MRDKEGNYLTTKEFLARWKKGIQSVTPLQQTKISLQGVVLVLIGVLVGIVSSFMIGIWCNIDSSDTNSTRQIKGDGSES